MKKSISQFSLYSYLNLLTPTKTLNFKFDNLPFLPTLDVLCCGKHTPCKPGCSPIQPPHPEPREDDLSSKVARFSQMHRTLLGCASYLRLRELLSEFLHFFPEIPDNSCVGILIHHSMVHDVLGTICVPQGGEGFIIVISCRTHSRHHCCLAITTKTVLQEEKKQ